MEAAAGTRSRLLLVLALIAGVLVGGAPAARSGPGRALPAPSAQPLLPAAQAGGPATTTRTLSRTGGTQALPAVLATAPAPAGAGPTGPVPAAVRLPPVGGARAAHLRRPAGVPPAAPASTQQDRAPPHPAGA